MNKTMVKILMGMALLSSLQAAEAELDEKSKKPKFADRNTFYLGLGINLARSTHLLAPSL
ncbi:hypothetical protein oki105_11640 [Helicobacter pylori]